MGEISQFRPRPDGRPTRRQLEDRVRDLEDYVQALDRLRLPAFASVLREIQETFNALAQEQFELKARVADLSQDRSLDRAPGPVRTASGLVLPG